MNANCIQKEIFNNETSPDTSFHDKIAIVPIFEDFQISNHHNFLFLILTKNTTD